MSWDLGHMKDDPYIPPIQANTTDDSKKPKNWYPTTFNIWNAFLIILLILGILFGIVELDIRIIPTLW